jgi:hypothetical protein
MLVTLSGMVIEVSLEPNKTLKALFPMLVTSNPSILSGIGRRLKNWPKASEKF